MAATTYTQKTGQNQSNRRSSTRQRSTSRGDGVIANLNDEEIDSQEACDFDIEAPPRGVDIE